MGQQGQESRPRSLTEATPPTFGVNDIATLLTEDANAGPGGMALSKTPILGDNLLKVVEDGHDAADAGSVRILP